MVMLHEVAQSKHLCQNFKRNRFSQMITLTTLTEDFPNFLSPSKSNIGIIPGTDHDRFFSHSFQFIYHLSSYVSKLFWRCPSAAHKK
jgi:hypothetical protein